MRRAIAISAFGLGSTSPNPPVGCVILDRTGISVGEGYHLRKGESHAEANALAAAGLRASGGTAVVTLEPCNHSGRTPPCHQALLDAGITRVLIALIDPTSRGDGGAARLRAAGVHVQVGVLADEALVVLGPWLETLRTARPRIVWAYEHGPNGSRPCSGEALVRLRSGVDVVLDTAGRVEEGVAGAHGADAFGLSTAPLDADPERVLDALYRRGVRSVLMCGDHELIRAHLGRDLINEVVVTLPSLDPSTAPHGRRKDGATNFLPDGFRIDSVKRDHAGLTIRASRIP